VSSSQVGCSVVWPAAAASTMLIHCCRSCGCCC
jgi:hypothetical protein